MTERSSANRGRTIDNDEVIEAARVMLLSVNVGEFSVRELAKSMGLVPGTIYARFGTKDELLAQLYLARLEAMMRRVDAIDPQQITTMDGLVAELAPEVGKLRHEFEIHFMRDAAPKPAVRDETWGVLQERFRVLSRKLYAQVRRVAANEGVTVVTGSVARRYVWAALASVPIGQSDVAYRHRNSSYRRFVSRSLLAALAAPADGSVARSGNGEADG
jgi:AcrR family transcriptional regulator